MIRFTFAFAALLAMCATSNAAVRTFATDLAGASVTDSTFELAGNWFVTGPDDTFDLPGDIISKATIAYTAQGGDTIPSGNYDLSRVDYFGPGDLLFITFTNGTYGDGASDDLLFRVDATAFGFVSGGDLPDSSSSAFDVDTRANFDSNDVFSGSYRPSGPYAGVTATIGTAAVPEPSAFAFGGLALAVTGAGRWARRRFFA